MESRSGLNVTSTLKDARKRHDRHLFIRNFTHSPILFKSWMFLCFLSLCTVSGSDQVHSESDAKYSSSWNVTCPDGSNSCQVLFNSTQPVLEVGLIYVEKIFNKYANNTQSIGFQGLSDLLLSIGIGQSKKSAQTHDDHGHQDHEDHDHEEHDHEEHDHEEHDHEEHDHGLDYHEKPSLSQKEDQDDNDQNETDYNYDAYSDIWDMFDDFEFDVQPQCLKSATEVIKEYYGDVPPQQVSISLSDFSLILPSLIYSAQSSCKVATTHHDDHEEKKTESTAKVWCIALVAVAVISLLSLIGIMIVPLMRHSNFFKRLLSFLVALAIGTLIGDALLHLLPHAMSGNAHDHGDEEKSKIIKSLVAVIGIYIFFIFESVMMMVRKRKQKKPKKNTVMMVSSPTRSDESLMHNKQTPSENGHVCSPPSKSPEIRRTNGIVYEGIPSNTPPFPLKLNLTNGEAERDNGKVVSEQEMHHHHHDHQHLHHDHQHHHHQDITKAHSVKDLVWMVIVGDGLHNFSDGLAIGAAFTSSISAGLSTSLAIFCHELPHEFGDFAILIDAGLSTKKALAYNAMSACIAFIGVIIGLIIGEYTTTVKLWILAVTAGGFLYVGLVDMLPELLKQCVERDGMVRFIFQNVGFLLGITIMLLIAWFEDSFLRLFNVEHGH